MLYADFQVDPRTIITQLSGHIGDKNTKQKLNNNFNHVVSIQVDGDELCEACQILGLQISRRVYTFVGDQAKTIAVNWESNHHYK